VSEQSRERRRYGWRSRAFDVAVALAAAGAEVAAVTDEDQSVAAVVLAVIAGLALVARRRAPLATFAVVWVAIAVLAVFSELAAGISSLVALYTAAAMLERRVSLGVLAATLALLPGVALANSNVSDSQRLTDAVVACAVCVGIWALGAYVQTRRRYLQELRDRAADLEREREQLARIAEHEERASIARELHDIVAHSVTVMLVGVRGARDVLRSKPEVADDTLARVETSGEQSLAELRRILALLRGPEEGAEARPQPSLAQLEELIAEYRDAGLPVRLTVAGQPRALPSGIELSVYRIVQEALTNVLKHSRPSEVTVTLSFRDADGLEVEVVDDGRAAAGDGAPAAGHGLVGMRERVALLGGELEAGRRAGGGFRVAARLPVGGDA
jgi:signal transduction histidine kinase